MEASSQRGDHTSGENCSLTPGGICPTCNAKFEPTFDLAELAEIRGVAGLAGPYNFYPFDTTSTRAAFGDAADPVATQPIHFVRVDAPPLFLAWGAEDALVGWQNIDRLAAAERAQGGTVETHIYPHVGHVGLMLALAEPLRFRAPVFEDVIAFARRVSGAGSGR
ncbi:MAG: hypothetical protein ABUS48_05765 [Pseudomonadota bacterium]